MEPMIKLIIILSLALGCVACKTSRTLTIITTTKDSVTWSAADTVRYHTSRTEAPRGPAEKFSFWLGVAAAIGAIIYLIKSR
jgi:hypothetical protein